jgi:ketosteroid isomerase-like protein
MKMARYHTIAAPWVAPLLLVAASCVGGAPASGRIAPSDDVAAFLERFITAFDNLDRTTFVGMFEDDATVFYPSPPNDPVRATGRREFEPAWQRVFQAIRGSRATPPFMDLRPERLHVQRLTTDAAIVTFELHDLPGLTGRRTLVLKRTHGVWRIAHLHASNTPASSDR